MMEFFRLLCLVYLIIDFIFTADVQLVGFLNSFFQCFHSILTLWIYNGQSEEIKQNIAELQVILARMEVSNDFVNIY